MTKLLKYPFLLSPVPKEILWGGNRLKSSFGKEADFEKIAESWELTARDDGDNTIANGALAGIPFSHVVMSNPTEMIGTSWKETDRFPLLVKFIDAADDLSVQVHPDDAYALPHENEYGKTEMWYIVEADEGARLVLGLKEGCTISDFAEAVETGEIGSKLNTVTVHKGDVFFIPPGMVHAIGGGILLAEIQQNSNVTYRVYDYNRKQTNGTLRPLHTKKALAVIKERTTDEIHRLQFKDCSSDPTLLCSCDYFCVRRYAGDRQIIPVNEKSFAHLLVLDAENASIQWGSDTFAIAKGDSWFLPAGLGEIIIDGKSEVLITTLP